MATVVGDLVVFLRANTLAFNKGMATAASRLKVIGTQMSKVGQMMTMKMSLPMALVGGAAIKMAMDFETSMQHIVGLVGVAQDQVNAWKADIKELAPELGKTSTELANAMFFITSAGLRGEEALNALKASAMGAAAGLGETAVVADAATSAMNAYGAANLSAEMATAVLVATVREGKAEASEIAPVIGAIIPVAAELGVEFHEVGAALSVMTRLGLNAALSATALRSTLATILKPTKQAADEMAKYGMSMQDLKVILKEQGLIALLMKLRDTFGDNEESMQKVFRNVRALNGVLSIVGKSAANNQKIFDSLANTTTGDLNNAFEVASQTAKFKLNAALADIQNTFIVLGETVMPTFIPLVEKLGQGFKNMTALLNKLNPAGRMLVTNLGLAVIAIGPMIWAYGKVSLAAAAAAAAVTKYNAATISMTASAPAAAAATNLISASMLPGMGSVAVAAVKAQTVMQALFTVTKWGTLIFTSFGAALAATALLVGVAIGSWIRPFVNELTGMNELFDLVAHTQADYIDELATSEKVWNDATFQLDLLKKQLNLTGKEWEYVNKQTEINAGRVAQLLDLAMKQAKAVEKVVEVKKRELTIAEEIFGEMTVGERQVYTAMLKVDDAHENRIELLKEELGLYTAEDIVDELTKVNDQYLDMKGHGIDINQLGTEFGGTLLEWLKLAKENNVQLPHGIREMAKDLKGKVNPAINEMTEDWKVFHNDINAAGKMIEGIEWSKPGKESEAALTHGFTQGITKGLESGTVEFGKWVKRIEDTTILIKPQLDLEGWNQAVQDAIEGRIPDTTG